MVDATAALTALIQHQSQLDSEHRHLAEDLQRVHAANNALKSKSRDVCQSINGLRAAAAERAGVLCALEHQAQHARNIQDMEKQSCTDSQVRSVFVRHAGAQPCSTSTVACGTRSYGCTHRRIATNCTCPCAPLRPRGMQAAAAGAREASITKLVDQLSVLEDCNPAKVLHDIQAAQRKAAAHNATFERLASQSRAMKAELQELDQQRRSEKRTALQLGKLVTGMFCPECCLPAHSFSFWRACFAQALRFRCKTEPCA